MPRNRVKVQCSHMTVGGRRCRNWVVRGSDPAACRVHGGRRPGGVGGQEQTCWPGTHAAGIEDQELGQASAGDREAGLEQEMAGVLMSLRRMVMILAAEGRFSPRVEAKLIWAGLGVSRNGGREKFGFSDETPEGRQGNPAEGGREASETQPAVGWSRCPLSACVNYPVHHTRRSRDVKREQHAELGAIADAIVEALDELAAERGVDP